MLYPVNYYKAINAFFDCYGLSYARYLLGKTIKTAEAEKIWKGKCPADLLYFAERLEGLMEAVFHLMETYDHLPEAILDKDKKDEYWFLQQYDSYCGWHVHSTPWDFFPRYLSKKEFLDPYKALKKFIRYRSLTQWKATLKEILEHALSPNSIGEFDNGTNLISTWLHLHKLLEATHLIEVRAEDDKSQHRRFKWKDRESSSSGEGKQINKEDEQQLS